jgi:hypothetical protein
MPICVLVVLKTLIMTEHLLELALPVQKVNKYFPPLSEEL